jgi:predicted RNA-binding protein YlqC (UPF0109 family)
MGDMSNLLKEQVESFTKLVVDTPNEVRVSSSVSTKAVIIQIKVEKQDCGKIIGKRGRTIEALKVLVLAVKNTQFPEDSRRIMLEVLEDENSSFTYCRSMREEV